MTGIRHFTASGIVFNEPGEVLLVHHNVLGMWLEPGGHIDANEDPAQAALREVAEETGIQAAVRGESVFSHPATTVHPVPYAIVEHEVRDAKLGAHHHIDFVYVMRVVSGELVHQPEEVSAARWVPVSDVAGMNVPEELPALIADAAAWAKSHT